MKVIFFAEQFVPPIDDGSTAVYESWLMSLSKVVDLYGVFFSLRGSPTADTHAFLREVCRDYLILPAFSPYRPFKIARALGRFVNQGLFAQAWIEEFGRGAVKQKILRFIDRVRPDLAIVSKLRCVNLIGVDILERLEIPMLMDLHDDFVAREEREREVFRQMMQDYPSLAGYPCYQNVRMRYWLSRFSGDRAREQENRMLRLFDRILIASDQEYLAYRERPEVGDRAIHLPWPIEIAVIAPDRSNRPEFEAGLIASPSIFNLEGLAWFIREVLPLIRRQRPEFQVLVVGDIISPLLMSGLPTEGLNMGGTVKSVADFYRRIRVSMVPLISGTGVSLKCLEGIRFGLPVVASPVGARGLRPEEFPNLYIEESAENFARRVLSVLDLPLSDSPAVARQASSILDEHAERFLTISSQAGIKVGREGISYVDGGRTSGNHGLRQFA